MIPPPSTGAADAAADAGKKKVERREPAKIGDVRL